MKYKLIKDNEVATEATIEKKGHVITFTMNEVYQHQQKLQEARREVQAKRDYEFARKTNVEQYHPFVLEMSEKDLFTAHMYQEAKTLTKMCDDKLEEIDAQLKEYEEEVVEIQKQIPELADSEIVQEAKEILNQ